MQYDFIGMWINFIDWYMQLHTKPTRRIKHKITVADNIIIISKFREKLDLGKVIKKRKTQNDYEQWNQLSHLQLQTLSGSAIVLNLFAPGPHINNFRYFSAIWQCKSIIIIMHAKWNGDHMIGQ